MFAAENCFKLNRNRDDKKIALSMNHHGLVRPSMAFSWSFSSILWSLWAFNGLLWQYIDFIGLVSSFLAVLDPDPFDLVKKEAVLDANKLRDNKAQFWDHAKIVKLRHLSRKSHQD